MSCNSRHCLQCLATRPECMQSLTQATGPDPSLTLPSQQPWLRPAEPHPVSAKMPRMPLVSFVASHEANVLCARVSLAQGGRLVGEIAKGVPPSIPSYAGTTPRAVMHQYKAALIRNHTSNASS